MEPKIIVLLLAFFFGLPLTVLAGLLWQPLRHILVIAICYTLCYPNTFNINLFSREMYRMSTRGIEIGVIDICMLALLFILMIRPQHGRFRWCPPMTKTCALFILISIFSWMLTSGNIPVPNIAIDMYAKRGITFYKNFETSLYPSFEISKLLRGALLFWSIINYVRTEKELQILISGLLTVAFLIAYEALSARYIHHHHRISATLGHPNSLGTFMAMMGTVMFGFTLCGKNLLSSTRFAMATAACMVSVLLTISRGALSAFVMGVWIDVSALLHRYFNFKNMTLLFIGSLMALGLFYIAADTITNRFVGQQDAVSDIQYRGMYNKEAKLMAKEHPLGIGLGNFSAYSWLEYGRRVGLKSYGTQAHNLWYLTLGEVGYPGLIAFIAYWLRFAALALPFLFRRRNGLFYAAAAASTAAVMIGHIQFMLQLSYRQTTIYLLTQILMGVVVAAWYFDRDVRHAERCERLENRKKAKILP